MLPYWLLFTYLAGGALIENRGSPAPGRYPGPALALASAMALFIGLRFEVGGDWFRYLEIFNETRNLRFLEILQGDDPGYALLSWLAARAGLEIWAVNLGCGLIFSLCLVWFAYQQPRPWLALVAATPVLTIVGAMGFTRQATATALLMVGVANLARGSTLKFVLWLGLAASFHITAALMLPLAALVVKNRARIALLVATVAIVVVLILFSDNVGRMLAVYIHDQMQSQGAAVRIMMNAIPAGLFLAFRHRFELERTELIVWTGMALGAISLGVLLLADPFSTALDRLGFYFIPVQIFVFSRVADIFGQSVSENRITTTIVLFYAVVQAVWMLFSIHSEYWLPYRMYPVEVIRAAVP